ncbi:Uncharacterized protein Fot_56440 [Forsythia ovata]|uniref:Ribosomal protein S10 n=1 Tax=Forsythia ovata TaxID=205694 RepID=A0ABD1P1L4_9LAMI
MQLTQFEKPTSYRPRTTISKPFRTSIKIGSSPQKTVVQLSESVAPMNLVTFKLSFRLRLSDKTTYSSRLVSYLFCFQARVALKGEFFGTRHKELQSLLIVHPLGERQEGDILYVHRFRFSTV